VQYIRLFEKPPDTGEDTQSEDMVFTNGSPVQVSEPLYQRMLVVATESLLPLEQVYTNELEPDAKHTSSGYADHSQHKQALVHGRWMTANIEAHMPRRNFNTSMYPYIHPFSHPSMHPCIHPSIHYSIHTCIHVPSKDTTWFEQLVSKLP
jgi:hypothetical protein